MRYQISYDLKKDKDYPKLYEGIKSYGDYCSALLSMWFIATDQTASQIYNKLKPLIDTDDHIFISEINANHMGYMPKEAVEWLTRHS